MSVHTRGWAWLNLNHDHIFFCPWKLDERDSKTNLSITGLENAIFNNRVRCIDSIFVSDPAWAPPEYNAFFPLSASQAVGSSDPNLFLNLPFIADRRQMFCLPPVHRRQMFCLPIYFNELNWLSYLAPDRPGCKCGI